MITGEIRNKVDAIWDHFYSAGVSNPLSVIEQFTYLLFLRQLDEQQKKVDRLAGLGTVTVNSFFSKEENGIRWSQFNNKTNPEEMFRIVKDEAFTHMKKLGGQDSKFARHLENAVFIIMTAALLQRVISGIDDLLTTMDEKNSGKEESFLLQVFIRNVPTTAG